MRPILSAIALLSLTLAGNPVPFAQAQEGDPVQVQSVPVQTLNLDDRLLRAVYQIDNPVFGGVMEAADLAAYPVFYGAVPAAWAGPIFFRENDDYTDAYLLTLSFVGTYLSSTFMKKYIRRPRPTLSMLDERGRAHRRDEWENQRYEFAMPSGHAAIAFTLATTYSLSHPEWYVVVPSFAWATSTAVSRVWRGRHFPTDVVAGMALGAAIAGGLHLAGPHITPWFFDD